MFKLTLVHGLIRLCLFLVGLGLTVLAAGAFTPTSLRSTDTCRLGFCPQANARGMGLPLRGASGRGGSVQGHSSDLVACRAAGQKERHRPLRSNSFECRWSIWTLHLKHPKVNEYQLHGWYLNARRLQPRHT